MSGDLNGVMNRQRSRLFNFDDRGLLARRHGSVVVRPGVVLRAVLGQVVELLEAVAFRGACSGVNGVVDEIKDQFVDLKCFTILCDAWFSVIMVFFALKL